MINGKRVAVVMPAYNAEETLESTVLEIPDLVDIRILVDDNSSDDTVKLAERLGLQVFVHNKNYSYGRNPADLLSRSFWLQVRESLSPDLCTGRDLHGNS